MKKGLSHSHLTAGRLTHTHKHRDNSRHDDKMSFHCNSGNFGSILSTQVNNDSEMLMKQQKNFFNPLIFKQDYLVESSQ